MYKKALLILPIAIVLLTTNTANGQKYGIGIKSGLNASTHFNHFQYLSDEGMIYFRPNFKIGYHFGFAYRYVLGPNRRIQVEPGLTTLGASYSNSYETRAGEQLVTDSNTDLLYVSMPLLFQLTTTPPDRLEYPKPWGETTYHFTGGIYGGYLLDAKFEGTLQEDQLDTELSENFSRDIQSQYSKFDAGIIIGVGMEHGLDSKFGVEVRGKLGVLNTGNMNNSSSNFNPKNVAVNLMVYYMF